MLKKSVHLFFVLIAVVGVSIGIPLLLNHTVFENNYPSPISNSDWSAFLGSYLGGVIGGAGTLIAVCITTLDTHRIEKKNQEETHKKERDNRIRETRNLICEFITEVKTYEYCLEKLAEISREHNEYTIKIERINSSLSQLLEETVQRKNLVEELNTYLEKEKKTTLDFEKRSLKTEFAVSSITKQYFNLTPLLLCCDESFDIIEDIRSIYDIVRQDTSHENPESEQEIAQKLKGKIEDLERKYLYNMKTTERKSEKNEEGNN